MLPGVTGYDLGRLLRQHEAHAALPVLFLTSQQQVARRPRGPLHLRYHRAGTEHALTVHPRQGHRSARMAMSQALTADTGGQHRATDADAWR